jgi:type IX secretion system PorP/SprF family membrane protein
MKKIFSIVLIVASLKSAGQQLQTSSFYELHRVIHNPSTAGVNGSMIGGSYRTQWSGLSGAPQTAAIYGAFELPDQQIGLGGYIYNDKTGPTSRTGVQLAFAKHISTGNEGKFSLGIEARGLQYSIDREKLAATLGSDPALGNSDNRFKFDAGFGISFTNKKLQIGAAVTQLVQSKLDFYEDNSTTRSEEASARIEHRQLFWAGMGFRLKQSITASAGFFVQKKLMLGYSFDLYRNPVSIFDNGGGNAHEIMLSYRFKK